MNQTRRTAVAVASLLLSTLSLVKMFFRCDFTVLSLTKKMSANFFVAHAESDLLEDRNWVINIALDELNIWKLICFRFLQVARDGAGLYALSNPLLADKAPNLVTTSRASILRNLES